MGHHLKGYQFYDDIIPKLDYFWFLNMAFNSSI